MIDPGSFRDPDSQVFYIGERVFRGLSESAASVDAAARDAGLMDRLVASGMLVENWRIDDVEVPAGLPSAAVVESRRIPVISHPAEWSFEMLRDAALSTLDTNLAAMDDGFVLKDASSFNVAFDGAKPVTMDVSSLDRIENHSVWTAYGQFVDHFLAPLMLEAYAGVPFQPTLSSSVVGMPVQMLDRLLRGSRRYRSGVTTHVRLRSRIERKVDGMPDERRSDVAGVALPAAVIEANIRKMRKLVSKLESSNNGHWEGYEHALPYAEDETAAKKAFIEAATADANIRPLALDVGANEGMFTRLLIDRFERVVAIDSDPGVVGSLYRMLEGTERDGVTPLVVDIVNQSPAFGLFGRERPSFASRVRPDFSMWLAVVHHLCIGQGVPIGKVVQLIGETSPEAVVEFVDPNDPMVRRISASRPELLDGYDRDVFETHLGLQFTLVNRESVSSTRTLYHVVRCDR